MKRTVFNEDHETFRKVVQDFLARDVQPHYEAWTEAGRVDKTVFHKAGEIGIPGLQIPEEYGGAGIESFKFNAVVARSWLDPASLWVVSHCRPMCCSPTSSSTQPRSSGGAGCPAWPAATSSARSR